MSDVQTKLDNPWLDAFDRLTARQEARVAKLYQDPNRASDAVWNSQFRFENLLGRLVLQYSFAIPTEEVIREIAKAFSPIVEIGAGNGYWAWMLQQAGAEVHAYDPDPTYYPWRKFWLQPQRGGARKVRYHENCTVLLCWPLFNHEMSYDAARNCRERLIFVGEWRGCTGSEEFFDYLDAYFEETGRMDIPCRPHKYDAVQFFERTSW